MGGNRIVFVLLFGLISNISLFGSVMLSVDGNAQYEAVLGEMFTVDLVIKGISKGFPDPVLANVPHGSIQRAGLYMSTINGKSEIRYSYHVRFDEIGSYILGPVIIVHGGNKVQSNQLFISVSHGKKESDDTKQDVFLRLTVDTDSAVVGQLITCTLACYVKRRGITIGRIIPPHITKAQLSNEQRSPESQEMIDGVQHTVIRWIWQIRPTEAGELVIPAAAIEYEAQTRNRGSFLFSLFSDSKRIYSNACIVHISPLPEYSGTCHATGQFSEFFASLSPTIIKKGEATTITLVLKGKGTFIPHVHYDLQGMPDAVRYYAVDPKQRDDIYTFEFIAQGVKEGVYGIPEQTFTFFNIDTKQYEQLRTTLLELHITENDALEPTKTYGPDDALLPEENSGSGVAVYHDEQRELQAFENPWFSERFMQSSMRQTKIPWALVIFLIIAMLLFKIVLAIFSRSERMHILIRRIGFKSRIFVAYWKLRRIERNNDIQQLHQLFVSLIASLYECPEHDVYLFVSDLSNKLQYVSQDGTTFDDFWISIFRAIYAEHKKGDQRMIYAQANRWIKHIGELL